MNLKKPLLCFCLGLTLLASSHLRALPDISPSPGKLVFAIDVIRHGDRTPVIELPKSPHRWPEGLGQLTPLGMHQEYELGKKFRQRYVEEERLLPKSYRTGVMYVRSSDFDRTLMSAECVLMGLYPAGTGPFLHPSFLMNWFAVPYGFQPIPIHTVSQDHDFLLLGHNNKEEIKQLMEVIPENPQKEAELKSHFPAWSQTTGIPLNNGSDLQGLGDLLGIYRLKHLPLPKGLSQQEATTIIEASTSKALTLFTKGAAGSSCGKDHLREIASYLEEATKSKSPLRYVLYSAHDNTIMALLGAMGIPVNSIPDYASDLNISLYDSGNEGYKVQVTLNGKVQQVPGAPASTCSLKHFISLAKKFEK